jgi:hypothetical protein
MKTKCLWKGLLVLVLGFAMTACQKDDNDPLRIISTQEVVREGQVVVEASYQNELKKMYFILVSPNTAMVTRATDFNPELVNRQYYGKEVIPDEFTHLGQTYSVVGIKSQAFWECNKLTSIVMPNTITKIGNYAFFCCTELSSVTLSNALEEIEYDAFHGCSNLASVDLPASIKWIGVHAFEDCTSLTSLTCRASTPPSFALVESDYLLSRLKEIKVPQASVNAYKSTWGWSQFADIIVGF